jgi:1,4-dihydroxy-2-naphthoate octaprenyltransferase
MALAAAVGVRDGATRAYIRLAKLDIVDYYLSVPLAWSMVPSGERGGARCLAVLGSFLLAEILLCAALTAFDDVTGFRDGSDAINYGPDAPARRLARKPLVAGTLTESQAVRFGWLVTAAYVVCLGFSVAAAAHRPTWVLVSVAFLAVLGFQYTWWLKLSYHGMQELFLVMLGVAFVLPLYGLLTGRATGFAVVQSVLFGLGPLLFGVYSNTNDRVGDRAVGRPTAAVLLSPRGNAVFIGALSASEAALIAGCAAGGLVPWWFPLVMLPVIALRVTQFVTGMARGHVLTARRLGIRVHRLTVVLLIIVNLVGVA